MFDDMEEDYSKLNVYIVGGDKSYGTWLPNVKLVTDMELAHLVIFTGGEDVHPSYYGEKTGSRTYTNQMRDVAEIEEFKKAQTLDKPLLGICRGAQFLTVMAGGKLIQHVEGHAGCTHPIIMTRSGNKFLMTSSHHQMLYPFNLMEKEYEIVAYSEPRSKVYLNGDDTQNILHPEFVEPEIVRYPQINALCIQGHPEWMDSSSDSVSYCYDLIYDFVYADSI